MKNTIKILAQKVTKNFKTGEDLKYPSYKGLTSIKKNGENKVLWLDLKFNQNVEGYKKLEYGYIEVEADGIDAPEEYNVRKNVKGKDGKVRDIYPTIWISKDILSYTPTERPKREKKPVTQNRFPSQANDEDIDNTETEF